MAPQKACKVSKDGRSVKYTAEIKLSNEEEAPMTMAVDRKASHTSDGTSML